MKKETEHGSEWKTAEKPRWDNWHVRLPNPKDQQRAIDLFQRSGAETKSDFVRARILGESFKVITVDKSVVEYYRKLSELTAQIHKIGVLYNQDKPWFWLFVIISLLPNPYPHFVFYDDTLCSYLY